MTSSSGPGANNGTGAIDELILRMDAVERRLVAAGDRNRIFHATYNRITHAVREEIAAEGFADNDWAEAWDVAFADLYLRSLDSWQSGQPTPAPWVIALDASRTRLPPLRHVLLGMNAHINYDLPQALIAVISDDEFDDPDVLARRGADHRRIDKVLGGQVAAEDEFLKQEESPGDRSWVDTLMKPFNRSGTRRFLRESRAKVWHNTRVLAAARRTGPQAYQSRLQELEGLCEEKVSHLLEPGHVLLKLARQGFGVVLPS